MCNTSWTITFCCNSKLFTNRSHCSLILRTITSSCFFHAFQNVNSSINISSCSKIRNISTRSSNRSCARWHTILCNHIGIKNCRATVAVIWNNIFASIGNHCTAHSTAKCKVRNSYRFRRRANTTNTSFDIMHLSSYTGYKTSGRSASFTTHSNIDCSSCTWHSSHLCSNVCNSFLLTLHILSSHFCILRKYFCLHRNITFITS